MRFLQLAAALCLLAHAALAQPNLPLKRAPTPTAAAITTADLMSRIYQFADDSMNGRLAGSAEAIKGTAYIAAELARLGLEPAGVNGTYFQDVPLVSQTADSSSTIVAGGRTFRAGDDFVHFGAIGAAGKRGSYELVFLGTQGDTTVTLTQADIRGKVLVVLPAPPGRMTQALFQSSGYRRYLDLFEAAEASIFVVAGDALSPQLRNAALRTSPFPQLLPDTAVTNRPAIDAVRSVADAMFGRDLSTVTPGTVGNRVDLDVRYALVRRPGRNVVALLRGRDPVLKHQYVAIGAHSDHIGVRATQVDHDSVRAYNTIARQQGADGAQRPATSEQWQLIRLLADSLRTAHGGVRLDSINNGADDDASGSMGILEIAERFARDRERPRRSLVFVWHVGEEEGMLGARYFTDHPAVPRDSIVAQLNVDMIGRGASSDVTGNDLIGGTLRGRDEGYVQLLGSRRLSTELGDLVEQINRDQRAGFQFDYGLDANGHPQNIYCRSDHAMYARFGIPIVFFTTGGHRDYHQVTDEPQYLNYEHYRRVTQFVADVALSVANRDRRVVVDKPKPDPRVACRQ